MPKRLAAAGEPAKAGFAAFLRAVNVSGANVIKMDELKRVFVKAGATDVSTYIQSGNVAFNLPEGSHEADFVSKVEGSLANAGVNSVVILRSKKELDVIASRMAEVEAKPPTSIEGKEHAKAYIFMFPDSAVSEEPPKEWAAKLDPANERYWMVTPKDALLWLGNGVGQSKACAPAALSKAFALPCTGRNLNTVNKMRDLLQ